MDASTITWWATGVVALMAACTECEGLKAERSRQLQREGSRRPAAEHANLGAFGQLMGTELRPNGAPSPEKSRCLR